MRTLLGFSARLTAAREELGWDIGDFCLERCKPTIDKLASVLGVVEGDGEDVVEQQVDAVPQQQGEEVGWEDQPLDLDADLLLPLDSLDQQFDLFDDFAAPWLVNL